MNAGRFAFAIILFCATFALGWFVRGYVEGGSAAPQASAFGVPMLSRADALAKIKEQYDGTPVTLVEATPNGKRLPNLKQVPIGRMRVDNVMSKSLPRNPFQ